MVMGDHGMPSMTTVGHLEVGTAAAPIAAHRDRRDRHPQPTIGGGVADPEQFGTGLLNFGKVTLHGAVKTPTLDAHLAWSRAPATPR